MHHPQPDSYESRSSFLEGSEIVNKTFVLFTFARNAAWDDAVNWHVQVKNDVT